MLKEVSLLIHVLSWKLFVNNNKHNYIRKIIKVIAIFVVLITKEEI